MSIKTFYYAITLTLSSNRKRFVSLLFWVPEFHFKNSIFFPSRQFFFFFRYMIAVRDIEPLELILKEDPAVTGPYSKSGSGCLHCLKKVDGSYLCSGCQFPLCNSECEKSILHVDECKFFQENDLRLKRRFCEISNGTNLNSPLWITPLRMLLKKNTDPKMFDRINMLRDHTAPKVSCTV